MTLRPEVVEQLLLCKVLLSRIRFTPVARPDRATLASHIITAHDAAELAIAAICHQLGLSPSRDQNYLMNYFQPLADASHKGTDVYAKDYFSQLNRVRVDIKHLGIFPDPQQWSRVGELVFGHVSKWCQDYLGVPLAAIDHSNLLIHDDVRVVYQLARDSVENESYKECMEHLAKALHELFHRNAALRGLEVGNPRPEDAIRLAGFGVPANDYLALQEFLPRVTEGPNDVLETRWEQSHFGHPGNWRKDAAEFCLTTFLEVALKIQHAEWIPGALSCDILYEFKVTPTADEVELWTWEYPNAQNASGAEPVALSMLLNVGKETRKKVGVLKKETPFVGLIFPHRRKVSGLAAVLGGGDTGEIESLELRESKSFKQVGNVDFAAVKVTRVARKGVEEWFPSALPEIQWEPE
jgi:hypothetical protein